ncbi:hypothetical protein [Carnobacterium gallinarum]
MLQVTGLFLVGLTIFLTQTRLKDNSWVLTSSILKLLIIGILSILLSIILSVLLGNLFILVLLTTLIWGTILQIRFANRVTVYNQTGE